METILLQEDPVDIIIYKLSLGLQRRNVSPVEIADLFYEALNVLHTASTKGRLHSAILRQN